MHYQQGHDRNQLFMTSLDQMVPEDSIARLIDIIVDEMHLEDLGFQHTNLKRKGNLPYHPKDMYKLLLYGARSGMRSAQKMANACTINVEVMWLLNGLHPAPRTINNFRSQNRKAIKNANRQFVKLLNQRKLADGMKSKSHPHLRGHGRLKKKFKSRVSQKHLGFAKKDIGQPPPTWRGYIT